MSLTDLILSLRREESTLATMEVEVYIQDKPSAELREELLPKSCGEAVGQIIRQHNIEFLIFKALTGYEAQEEITRQGTSEKPGYVCYSDLAHLLSGRSMTGGKVREYFLDLAEKNNMPLLTEASISYIEHFNVEFIQNTLAEDLKARIPIFAKPIKKPENYALFLRALHQKVKNDPVLQYEMFKKWAGIETEGQITYAGTEDIPGYSQLKSLAAFFTGRVMTEEEAGRHFKYLIRTKGGIVKTQTLTEIILGFGKDTKPTNAAKVITEYTSSMTPQQVREELPLHLAEERDTLSRKIRHLKLEYVLLIAATGYEAQEDIKQVGTPDKLGYSSLTALAYLLSGTRKGVTGTGKYFRHLAKENNMLLLTPYHQSYLDKFSIEYVKTISSKQLQEEIPVVKIRLNPTAGNYTPFLIALSRKVSSNREFQYEFLRKWAGTKTKEKLAHIIKQGIPGSCPFKSMATFLSGVMLTKPQSHRYIQDVVTYA